MGNYKKFRILTFAVILVVLNRVIQCDNHLGDHDKMDEIEHECVSDYETGSCRDFGDPHWYYNVSSKQCDRFWYGGCGGNGNNYETQEQCESHCMHADKGTDNIVIKEDDAKVQDPDRKPGAAHSKCLKDKDNGRFCAEWKVKWYYNQSSSECERFWFGGCDGNDNRFEDKESCARDCIRNEDICRMSVVMGNCRERLPRWYYDSARRECRYFEYSGCNGNGNRFITRDDCERQCIDEREAFERTDCRTSRYGCCPDQVTAAQDNNNEGCPNACKDTRFGCCDDEMTAAQGPDQEGCEVIEISSGDPVPCSETDYGCCPDGETAATGPSREGCPGVISTSEKMDGDITVDVPAQCKLPSDLGTCRDNMVVMWYYNVSSSRCQMFWYGGCNGNQNRFKSEKECLTICRQVVKEEPEKPEVSVPVCEQPKEIGPCRALIKRWFYNQETRQCEEFNYGGCQGNQNNFEERETCERYCRRGTPVTKPGRCPAISIDEVSCSSTCYYDGDCPGDQKCCSGPSGCRQCYSPAREEITLTPEQICAQDKDTGPCRAAFTRYYYNGETGDCESFIYGGCRGNKNNFESLDLCRRYCRARVEPTRRPRRQNICELRPALGPCDRTVTKYYYNMDTLSCQTFTYGGCLGNHNNFVSEEKCMSYCGIRERDYSKEELCKQEYATGSCRGSFSRFYYDARQGRCFQFTYGGCQGNGNNFVSDESCMDACRGVRIEDRRRPRPNPTVQPPTGNRAERREEDVCSLPLQTPCNTDQTGPFWYYDTQTGVCREVPDGECNNNRNNFQSRAQCEGYCSRDRVCQPLYYTSDIRCLALIPAWTYNGRTGRCESFNYGGCGGSANNFGTEDACRRKCEERVIIQPVTEAPEVNSPAEEDVCSLPLQTPCNTDQTGPFWYYDKQTGACREVPDGECNNNRNNFQSRAQCEGYCSRDRVCQPLYYTSDIRCLALIPAWTYNGRTGRCESFNYGGCGGSANNFGTEDACRRKCEERVIIQPVTEAPEVNSPAEICAMPEDSGNCLASMQQWRYDSTQGQCVQFIWGGCGGNKNNFETREQCESYCSRRVVCQQYQEPDVECLAYFRRWKYDPSSNQCENFIYGGCGGNANNFETFEACENKCIEKEEKDRDRDSGNYDNRVSTWRDICQMRYDVGPCRQSTQKWYYNSGARKCETFTYGGCLGNHNNFESEEQCLTYCGNVFDGYVRPTQEPEPEPEIEGSGEVIINPTGVDRCHLPSETGVCRALINLWYYDKDEGECMRFVYGGCEGNANRFSTKEECERHCNDREICLLTRDSGMGFNYTNRYYFDYGAQTCRSFVFGGEDGNANNFMTETACMRKCDSLIRRAPAPKTGVCPPRTRNDGLLGACAPQCRDDSQCSGSQKCCYSGCGYKCVDPVSEQRGPKPGYCPAKIDSMGLLGACAPQCQDDRDCSGSAKCCYHGCGLECVNPVAEEPYQMDIPVRVEADAMNQDSISVKWADPSLGQEQLIRDNRFYTIRYFTYDQGRYRYMNVTDLRGRVNALSPDTEYHFSIRANNPPYLSDWSTDVMSKTMPRVTNKPGSCPTLDPNTVGVCINMCDEDTDCSGAQKCCSNGCGQTCVNPTGYDICSLPMDRGLCTDWTIRWYYKVGETGEGMCDRFWFGGCESEGNGNRFLNQTDCEAACGTVKPTTEAPRTPRPYDCRRSMFGCCEDGYTPAVDAERSNCIENQGTGEEVVPATPGESVTLRCRGSNDGTWYREGKLVESNDRRRINDDGTLTVFSATIDDDGVYACHVNYGLSQPYIYRYRLQVRNTSDEAVEVPIGILDGPNTIEVKPNHMAFLHCEAYGNPKPTVSWQKNGQALRTGTRYETFSNGTLLIRRTTESDVGRYTCIADNRVSQSVSRNIKLNLREMLVARIENDNGRVTEGGRITLSCEGRGYPTPTLTWEKMGQEIRTGGNVFISSEGRLVIRDASLGDTGTYTCIVANSEEKIETSTSVQVIRRIIPEDDDKCEDKTSLMKCRLIVTARLCGYTMYSKICCNSCKSYFRRLSA